MSVTVNGKEYPAYPYKDVARQRGLDYGDVLRTAHYIETAHRLPGNLIVNQEDYDVVRGAVDLEWERRREMRDA